ncbi:MAG: hypothetical protein JST58_15145 [Bacteroidetes bacterium]|nr:hypothetical protein [Bacteroidota bacterium]
MNMNLKKHIEAYSTGWLKNELAIHSLPLMDLIENKSPTIKTKFFDRKYSNCTHQKDDL